MAEVLRDHGGPQGQHRRAWLISRGMTATQAGSWHSRNGWNNRRSCDAVRSCAIMRDELCNHLQIADSRASAQKITRRSMAG